MTDPAAISAADGDRRGRLSRPCRAVRGCLSSAQRDPEPPSARPGADRRGNPGAEHCLCLAQRRLA